MLTIDKSFVDTGTEILNHVKDLHELETSSINLSGNPKIMFTHLLHLLCENFRGLWNLYVDVIVDDNILMLLSSSK